MKFKYRTLVNRHEQQVYALAFRMLRCSDEAADVTQEVYIKLWKNIHHVELERAKSWLLAVTRNLCIDQMRLRKEEEDFDSLELSCLDISAQPAKALESSRLSRWLKDAIGELREPYRSLIIMNDLQQKKQSDIAKIFDLSVNQVKVYVHRARLQLRERLCDVGEVIDD